MSKKFPDVESLESRFVQYMKSIDETYDRGYDLYIFPQAWPNTGGGFAAPGYVYGQAFTTQYTTIFVDTKHDTAMVAFDNDIAYYIPHLTSEFFDDLARHNMAGAFYHDRYKNP